MAKVLLPVADGSEDIETVTLIDVLRRAEINVTVASIQEAASVKLARGTLLTADVCLDDVDDSQAFDAIVLPGGMPGAARLRDCEKLKTRLLAQREASGWIAAICAAPGIVLAPHDLVRGHDVTGYPAFQAPLAEAGGHISQRSVIEDRQLVTSQGPATAMAFALHLVGLLVDDETEARIAEGLLVDVAWADQNH